MLSRKDTQTPRTNVPTITSDHFEKVNKDTLEDYVLLAHCMVVNGELSRNEGAVLVNIFKSIEKRYIEQAVSLLTWVSTREPIISDSFRQLLSGAYEPAVGNQISTFTLEDLKTIKGVKSYEVIKYLTDRKDLSLEDRNIVNNVFDSFRKNNLREGADTLAWVLKKKGKLVETIKDIISKQAK